MKFSEKGLESFDKQMTNIAVSYNEDLDGWDRYSATRQVEFEPEDFDGAVILSLKEAKALKNLIWKLQGYSPDGMDAFDWFTYWVLNGEIEKVEGKKDEHN